MTDDSCSDVLNPIEQNCSTFEQNNWTIIYPQNTFLSKQYFYRDCDVSYNYNDPVNQ